MKKTQVLFLSIIAPLNTFLPLMTSATQGSATTQWPEKASEVMAPMVGAGDNGESDNIPLAQTNTLLMQTLFP